jgi:hypothetical protein
VLTFIFSAIQRLVALHETNSANAECLHYTECEQTQLYGFHFEQTNQNGIT